MFSLSCKIRRAIQLFKTGMVQLIRKKKMSYEEKNFLERLRKELKKYRQEVDVPIRRHYLETSAIKVGKRTQYSFPDMLLKGTSSTEKSKIEIFIEYDNSGASTVGNLVKYWPYLEGRKNKQKQIFLFHVLGQKHTSTNFRVYREVAGFVAKKIKEGNPLFGYKQFEIPKQGVDSIIDKITKKVVSLIKCRRVCRKSVPVLNS